MFSQAIKPFYILTSNVGGFQCLHILANTGYCLSITAIQGGVKWCSTVGSILISPND